MRQPLGASAVPAQQIAAIRRLCKDLNMQTVEFTTEARLDDFAESLLAPSKGSCRPVTVKFGEIDAELDIMWIGNGQAWGTASGNYVDFRAWVYFRDGSNPQVGGRYFHCYDGLPVGESRGGFIYRASDESMDPARQFFAVAQHKD